MVPLRRRKEPDSGAGSDAAGIAHQKRTLRHNDARLQAQRNTQPMPKRSCTWPSDPAASEKPTRRGGWEFISNRWSGCWISTTPRIEQLEALPCAPHATHDRRTARCVKRHCRQLPVPPYESSASTLNLNLYERNCGANVVFAMVLFSIAAAGLHAPASGLCPRSSCVRWERRRESALSIASGTSAVSSDPTWSDSSATIPAPIAAGCCFWPIAR